MAFASSKKKSPGQMREADRARAKRAALRALRKAKAAAEKSGAKLSDWEGEFLGSVEGRLKTYGRAFADPEKGALGASLSIRQTVKVKEIAAKAKDEGKARFGRNRRFRQNSA
ncbi:MAG: hypothetical protein WBQ17_08310 [Rhizomicrobium sp.]